MALSVIAVWVTRSGRNPIAVLIPLGFLLVMTTWALILNLRNFIEADQWVLAPLDAIIFVLAIWLMAEAAMSLRKAFSERDLVGTTDAGDADAVAKANTDATTSDVATSDRPLGGPSDGDRR
ncbi:hypothetical protein [Blastococcus brunescens]|uniref:Uncharacterized protein n=1 Tax=Blastococcus brunescens TaxID=1564165 RepID=A0ABZ1B7X0_9ACTN|nr:hypothetical protein [Blastococcus sp. BMG 8361]WRL66913.1 hypothetical protein U6N30_09650 [Blastococcus sp. BMG 8361]